MTWTIKPEKEGQGQGKQEGKKSISAFVKKTKEGLRRTFAFPDEEGKEEEAFKPYPESIRPHGRM